MTMPEQRATARCECGKVYRIIPTESTYEFDWRCLCGRSGTISWAHAHPPPTFNNQAELIGLRRENE